MTASSLPEPASSPSIPTPQPGAAAVDLRVHRWSPSRKCRAVAWISGLLVLVLALAALAGWTHWYSQGYVTPVPENLGQPFLAALLQHSNAMVVSTALGFVLLATALQIQLRRLALPRRRFLVVMLSLLIVAWSLAQLVAPTLDRAMALPARNRSEPAARLLAFFSESGMSPGTACSFVLAGTALVLLALRPGARRRAMAVRLTAVMVAANLVLLYGFICNQKVYNYVLGIPVAFPTTLAFVSLGVALLAAAGPRNVLLRRLLGPGTPAVLLRAFLPIAVVAVLLGEWLRLRLEDLSLVLKQEHRELWSSARAAVVGLWVYVIVILVCLVVDWVAARVGKALEQARTELQETLKRLREKTDEAQTATAARDLFLAQVSHELRTPLNHILGYCQLMELTPLDESQQTDLQKIRRAGDHLLVLINDILDYQKIVIGKIPIELEAFAPGAWIQQIAESMTAKIQEKGNHLKVDCEADLGLVRADRNRFRQVLVNLLGNAAKFTERGMIRVVARRRREGERESITVSVGDTGKGIRPADQLNLFNPFAKLPDAKDNPEGTGLGLAISRNLCRLMGGDITLASEIGKGTTFTVVLPAAGENASSQTTATMPRRLRETIITADRVTSQRPSVLVIDDDPQVGELMKRFLENQGFVIHTATSGAQALDMVKKLRPAAITLDIMMPGIDGWGTLAALKNDAETAPIPVIIVSITENRIQAFRLGASEFLTKPVNWEHLAHLLRRYKGPGAGSILVIDDDVTTRAICRCCLTKEGWQVVEADNGQMALDLLARHQPSLIVLDLMMPILDGFGFLERLRQCSAWRALPVIVLTAKNLTKEDRERLTGRVLNVLEKQDRNLEELLAELVEEVECMAPLSAPP